MSADASAHIGADIGADTSADRPSRRRPALRPGLSFRPPILDLSALFERLDYWRRRALKVETPLEADLVEWFALWTGAAKALAALYEAEGRPCTGRALAARAGVGGATMKTYLWQLRQALDEGGLEVGRIPSPSGRGAPHRAYALTSKGLAECEAALAALAAERAALVRQAAGEAP